MSMRKFTGLPLFRARCAPRAAPVEGPNLGQPITQAELAAWDTSMHADGAGLPPGAAPPRRARESTRKSASRAMVKNGKAACHGARPKAPDHQHQRGGEDHRELLAVCDNAVRLHSARDAVAAAEIADQRRSLRVDRLHPRAEQAHRRKRRDERDDAAENTNAEPRRLYRPLSGPDRRSLASFSQGDPPQQQQIPALFNSSQWTSDVGSSARYRQKQTHGRQAESWSFAPNRTNGPGRGTARNSFGGRQAVPAPAGKSTKGPHANAGATGSSPSRERSISSPGAASPPCAILEEGVSLPSPGAKATTLRCAARPPALRCSLLQSGRARACGSAMYRLATSPAPSRSSLRGDRWCGRSPL